MTPEHRRYRDALAAYAVGALDPSERTTVEAHLADCPACRDELASLAALPGLLSRLSAEEAASGPHELMPQRLDQLTEALGARRRSTRRTLWAWRTIAAAAAVALAIVIVPLPAPTTDSVYVPRPAVIDASAVTGGAVVEAHPWGMSVELEVDGLPERRGYVLWAVSDDGHRAQVASWTATENRSARLTGSCYVSRDDLGHLEVLDPDDELLFVLEAAAS